MRSRGYHLADRMNGNRSRFHTLCGFWVGKYRIVGKHMEDSGHICKECIFQNRIRYNDKFGVYDE